ncbi:UNVERIFIED_CONTAM: putative pentatricopeptide repeat-containing protein [Sesamum calycinum]|uniref:Pentatricopeptide repeat-containing protein n=1 Tax=Sesamum calycinum TaxID=2727403 RepID=A0AAW2M0R3_9LAMI
MQRIKHCPESVRRHASQRHCFLEHRHHRVREPGRLFKFLGRLEIYEKTWVFVGRLYFWKHAQGGCHGGAMYGQQVHSDVVKMGFEDNVYAASALLDMYAKCSRVEDADKRCMELFLSMEMEGVRVDDATFAPLLTLLYDVELYELTRQLHGKIVKCGLEHENTVINATITAYAECGSIQDAERVFDSADGYRDLVTWNSMLAAYLEHDLEECGFDIFIKMVRLRLDLDAYSSNNQSMEDALKVFKHIDMKDLVSWNTILTGLSQNGLSEKCLEALPAVASSLHGLEGNEYVASALIFMYSKCGIIEDAWKSFEASHKDSSVTWNSIIFAYAQHGQGKVALDLFYLMTEGQVKLDHVTFVAALTACSHIGLVEEGRNLLKSMETEYGIQPRMENYACAIDLLGRAGLLTEAKELIDEMPFEPDVMVWKTLLGACRACGDIQLATYVADHLLELDPGDHCTYVLLCDMYGHLKRWDEKASVKKMMRNKGVKKVPGWSWIELQNDVHAFNAEDHSHPNCREIYQALKELTYEIRISENASMLEVPLDDVDLASGYWIVGADGFIQNRSDM